MPDINIPPLYNPVLNVNRPHLFTGDHMSILLEKFYTWSSTDLAQNNLLRLKLIKTNQQIALVY